jgi:hypothetical protein
MLRACVFLQPCGVCTLAGAWHVMCGYSLPHMCHANDFMRTALRSTVWLRTRRHACLAFCEVCQQGAVSTGVCALCCPVACLCVPPCRSAHRPVGHCFSRVMLQAHGRAGCCVKWTRVLPGCSQPARVMMAAACQWPGKVAPRVLAGCRRCAHVCLRARVCCVYGDRVYHRCWDLETQTCGRVRVCVVCVCARAQAARCDAHGMLKRTGPVVVGHSTSTPACVVLDCVCAGADDLL